MNAPAAPPAINRTMTPIQWLMLIALSSLWGASFLFLGVSVSALPVFTVIFLRVLIAAVIVYAAMRLAGENLPRTREAWRAFFIMSLLNNIFPFLLLGFGQKYIAIGLAAVLTAATPIIANVTAHFMWSDEPFTANRVVGVILGIVGVAVMFGTSAFHGIGINFWAELACLGAAICFGLSGVYGRRLGQLGITPLPASTGQLIISSGIMVVLAFGFDQPWTLSWPAPHIVWAVIGLAVLSTALAYIFYYRLLRQVGSTNTVLVTVLLPVFAVFYGAVLLHERLEPRHYIGFAIVIIGLAATDGRVLRWIGGRMRAG